MDTLEKTVSCGIVPVVVLDDAAQAIPTARALLAGGINVMEITFRTAAAKESIRLVSENVPEMTVGAGTVLSIEQLEDAVNAGAKFIVCPGSDKELIAATLEKGLLVIPGVVTPSEIMMGLKLGLKVFKFFPAEAYGGLKTIKALCGPFPQIRFLPTGGINLDNVTDYFKNQKIIAVGGSWMVTADMVRSGRFDEITEKSKAATDLFKQIRG